MRNPDQKSFLAFHPGREPRRRPHGATTSLQKEQARRLLPALVGRMCLEIYDRNWVPMLPYTLWETVIGATRAQSEFRVEEIALFRMLAQVAEGWIRYDPENGPVFISQGRWRRRY